MNTRKTLNVFYSRNGQNYVGGRIVNLPIGNTRVIAEKIQTLTGCELFQVETTQPYPLDYTEATQLAQQELRTNARPILKTRLPSIAEYGVIYLGYPNWWGTMPMALFTFLEAYDFSGKTLVPYCTHEGSGSGSSERDIKKLCPTATVLSVMAFRGGSVGSADEDVERWLKQLQLI